MSDLSELFDRNPLGLTTEDVGKIIERMRQAQAQYELGVKLPRSKPTNRRTAPKEDLLKDLGL